MANLIGASIHTLRTKLDLSIDEVPDFTEGEIAAFESGARTPSDKELELLAEALGLEDPSEFFAVEEPANDDPAEVVDPSDPVFFFNYSRGPKCSR